MKMLLPMFMLYAHIIDAYVLQGCLANLKQRSWWADKLKLTQRQFAVSQYSKDYIMALIMHACSWAVSIMLPLIIYRPNHARFYVCMFLLNAAIHAVVDDQKANRHTINLIQDQLLHMAQIAATFISWLALT